MLTATTSINFGSRLARPGDDVTQDTAHWGAHTIDLYKRLGQIRELTPAEAADLRLADQAAIRSDEIARLRREVGKAQIAHKVAADKVALLDDTMALARADEQEALLVEQIAQDELSRFESPAVPTPAPETITPSAPAPAVVVVPPATEAQATEAQGHAGDKGAEGSTAQTQSQEKAAPEQAHEPRGRKFGRR